MSDTLKLIALEEFIAQKIESKKQNGV